MIMAFSGHRPEKLPWGGDETDPRCQALKTRLAGAVCQAADEGVTTFLCGMARGTDLYFAEAVLALALQRPGLELHAWLPCPSQADRWSLSERARYLQILSQCARVYTVEPVYSDGSMLRRNRLMVEQCDLLLTVWDGSNGGTASAIRHARKLAKPIRGLWL